MNKLTDFERLNNLVKISPIQIKYIGESPIFADLYRRINDLINEISNPESSRHDNESALLLRSEIIKSKISPKLPDKQIFINCGLGDKALVTRKWGEGVSQKIEKIREIIFDYNLEGSLLNTEFISTYLDIYEEFGPEKIKIFCRSNERNIYIKMFEGLLDLENRDFITNITEYRQSPFLEALFSFGPFWAYNFAPIPESIVFSPIYNRLIRFTWRGINDEIGFGCDPIDPKHNYLDLMELEVHTLIDENVVGSYISNYEIPEDIPLFLPNDETSSLFTPCVLIELPEDTAMLFRPGSELTVYSKEFKEVKTSLASQLVIGEFLVIHDVKAGLGGATIDVSSAPLAQVWKRALRENYEFSPSLFIQRITSAGLKLKSLANRTEAWIELGDTVISAPQRKEHFKILINEVLGKEILVNKAEKIIWWQRAWAEVETSRDNARKHGAVKHSIINDQVISILSNNIERLECEMSEEEIAKENFAQSTDLNGYIYIKKIISKSSNYSAPADLLEKTMTLIEAEQYSTKQVGEEL